MTIKITRIPKFVSGLSALRLMGDKYYRDGGCWDVGYHERDGKIFSTIDENIKKSHELKEISEEEWRECNKQYAPKKIDFDDDMWFVLSTKRMVYDPISYQVTNTFSSFSGKKNGYVIYLGNNKSREIMFVVGENVSVETEVDMSGEWISKESYFLNLEDALKHYKDELIRIKTQENVNK